MKKKILTGIAAIAMVTLISSVARAQTKAGKVIDKTEETAKKVGDKSAEVAVKGASKVVDKTYKNKMAPDGSNVYIDNKNRKYYIDQKGKKIFLKASEIKDRPKK